MRRLDLKDFYLEFAISVTLMPDETLGAFLDDFGFCERLYENHGDLIGIILIGFI